MVLCVHHYSTSDWLFGQSVAFLTGRLNNRPTGCLSGWVNSWLNVWYRLTRIFSIDKYSGAQTVKLSANLLFMEPRGSLHISAFGIRKKKRKKCHCTYLLSRERRFKSRLRTEGGKTLIKVVLEWTLVLSRIWVTWLIINGFWIAWIDLLDPHRS
jgi:hypothetical protein